MPKRLPDILQRPQRRSTTILTLLVGLILFTPLAGCGNGNNSVNISGSKTPTQTQAQTPTATKAGLSTPTATAPNGWQLIWSDEFSGPSGTPPDPSKWNSAVGGSGWGNEQLDYDTNNQNAYQDGQGNLVIEARKETSADLQCWYGACQYTSAQLNTTNHFSFTYGRIEARMKLPKGQGIWPAFWLLGDNCSTVGWPTCGEVDIMEMIGAQPDLIYGTVHGPAYYSSNYSLHQGDFSDDFHTFALEWDINHLYFLVDGIKYGTYNRTADGGWVYNHSFHIVLDLAVGGTWPGSPNYNTAFPAQLVVSYIRVYTKS